MIFLEKSFKIYNKLCPFLLWFGVVLIVLNQTILGAQEDMNTSFPKLEIASSTISSGVSIYGGFKLKKFQNFLTIAIFLSSGVVIIAKKIIKKERPDGSNFKSFPSGHSVVLATFMFQFLFNKQFDALLKILPFAFFVFIQRILCRRHFVEDVLTSILLAFIVSYLSKKIIKYVEK
jgi:membrane-associated phospholipid phosphatase